MMRVFLSLWIWAFLAVSPAFAQASATSPADADTASTAKYGVKPQDFEKGLGAAMQKLNALQANVISGAVGLSQTVKPEASKFAFGLGVLTIVMAGFSFAGSHHPIGAWMRLLETLLVLGIFSALYVGYDTFGAGIYTWMAGVATQINGANPTDATATMAVSAGGFFNASMRALSQTSLLDDVLPILVFAFALFLTAIVMAVTALVYLYFIFIGQIQVAVGIVLGPFAVALGFHDATRKYFFAWLDYMISGSLYIVVAAIMGRLVTATLLTSIAAPSSIGWDTLTAGIYCLGLSLLLLLVSFEIPRIAGSLFATGAGAGGGTGLRLATGGANAGNKLLASGAAKS